MFAVRSVAKGKVASEFPGDIFCAYKICRCCFGEKVRGHKPTAEMMP